nr:immunoglobulin heavy chain junction region [Macaca mulatta]MOW19258.1 immunoglobulin heavy chain junction region [Macaca mulatta]MOW21491.1 immunoglobulin heavy chain junction region [Macaca mulatta]MOW22189.1 immunoglobulin heavy chain junction region [Macaca mulatta]
CTRLEERGFDVW